MTSKIKIKVGHVEVEFEGSEEFLSKELLALLKSVSSIYTSTPPMIPESVISQSQPVTIPSTPIQMTTNSIAAKLSVKSGTDLIIAAAANLTLVKGAPTFSRQEILKEMQTASSYYKKTFCANLSKYLKAITVDGRLIENSTNAFALSAKTRADLESKLVS